MPAELNCPQCHVRLKAKTQAAADMVKDCLDHPTPNVRPVDAGRVRCVEVGPFGRCELEDMHRCLHQRGDKTWARYDKWNPYCKEELVEMAMPGFDANGSPVEDA